MTQDLASYDHFPLSVASCAFSFSRSLTLQARQHVFASSPCANLETLLSEIPSPGSGSWSLTWRQWVGSCWTKPTQCNFLNGGDFLGVWTGKNVRVNYAIRSSGPVTPSPPAVTGMASEVPYCQPVGLLGINTRSSPAAFFRRPSPSFSPLQRPRSALGFDELHLPCSPCPHREIRRGK